MRTFTDADGKEWGIELTVGPIKRVRDELQGVDLCDLGPTGPLMRCATDFCLLVDILSVLLTPEIKRRNTDAESFAIALRGDALDKAAEALQWAVIDFFPQRQRETMTKAMEKTNQILARKADHAHELMKDGGKIDQLLTAELDLMDQSLESVTQNPFGGRSIVTPASSA